MTTCKTLLTTGAVIAVLTAPLAAQTATDTASGAINASTPVSVETQDMTATAQADAGLDDQRATVGELIGRNITNAIGESIGEIDDIVEIRGETMAVIGVGGLFGIGEHDVALPVTELSVREGDIAAMGYTLEQLKSMEEIRVDLAKPLRTDAMIKVGNS